MAHVVVGDKPRMNDQAPWLEGFELSKRMQASSCMSTTGSDVLIHAGLDRFEIGNSLVLKTLAGCPWRPCLIKTMLRLLL